jgi:DNA repair protein RadD
MAERDYQIWGIEEILKYFEVKTGNPVVAMPTGTGKSHMISGFALKALRAYPMTRIMVLTHVKELIQQNYNKFIDAWPTAPAGIFSAGLNKKEFHLPITFGGIASVAKKAHLFAHIDLLFIDECDLVNPTEKSMYAKFIAQLKKQNPYLKVIGLTATPWRAGLGHITNEGGLFTDVAVDMTGVDAFNWFIEEGYLIPLVPKRTKLQLDITGVHMRGGDYVESELQLAVDKDYITEAALREVISVAGDRKRWLIFASGVQHAKNIVTMLHMLGVSAKAVYSGMEKDGGNRDKTLDEHKRGDFTAIVNNNILTTGYDDAYIDLIIMLRPTGSSRLWVQMLGRGTRPVYDWPHYPETKDERLAAILNSCKHNCLVLDFASNGRKLGPINDPVIPRQRGKGPPGIAPVKDCPVCEMENHTTVRFCGGKPKTHPNFNPAAGCGYEFIFEVKLKIEASTTELIKGKIDLPVVESFKVDQITYTLHVKVGSEPMMKVTYYCGLKNFTDFVCVQHPDGNYARKRARDWWKQRTQLPVPSNTDDALDQAQTLAAPTHLEVWINQKYPTITRYCFDGSNFGRIDAGTAMATPIPEKTITSQRMRVEALPENLTELNIAAPRPMTPARQQLQTMGFDDMDDDIPF